MILLPVAIVNQLSPTQMEAIILHELAHIKRLDYLINFIQSIIKLFLFFNPFAAVLNRIANAERENCCDDWVSNFEFEPLDYGNALLLLEEHRQQRVVLALAATSGKKKLLCRIKRLFNNVPQTNITSLQKFQLMTLGIVLLICFTVIFQLNGNINFKSNFHCIAFNKKKSSFIEKGNLAIPTTELPYRHFHDKIIIPTPVHYQKKYKKKQFPPEIKTPLDNNYTLALINEDLLNNINTGPLSSNVSEKDKQGSYSLITIQEEQSGKAQLNRYYFQLINENGRLKLKPLLLLNNSYHFTDSIKKRMDIQTLYPKKITL
jgi:hypothetical protein